MTTMTDKEILELVFQANERFKGDITDLQKAVGTLILSRNMGWKPIFLIHERRTIKKYEQILGVEFRQVAPDIGKLAHKSFAWRTAQKFKNFWKAVKGEIAGVRSASMDEGFTIAKQ